MDTYIYKVMVMSLRDGFRRAGRVWSSTPVETQVDKDQLAALEAEPMLRVRRGWASETDAVAEETPSKTEETPSKGKK